MQTACSGGVLALPVGAYCTTENHLLHPCGHSLYQHEIHEGTVVRCLVCEQDAVLTRYKQAVTDVEDLLVATRERLGVPQ